MSNPESLYGDILQLQIAAESVWQSGDREPSSLRLLSTDFLTQVRRYVQLQFRFTFGENYKRSPRLSQIMQTDFGFLNMEHNLENLRAPESGIQVSIDQLSIGWGNNWLLEVLLSSQDDLERLVNAKITHQEKIIEFTSRTNSQEDSGQS